MSEAAVAARQRAVAEKVEGALPDGAVEVLLIWIIEYGAMLLELIAITLMFIFKREFDISSLYGIREMDLLYYLFFGLIVVPAESLCDVLLLNAAERLHGWRVVAYLQRLDRRYQKRSTTWVLAVTMRGTACWPHTSRRTRVWQLRPLLRSRTSAATSRRQKSTPALGRPSSSWPFRARCVWQWAPGARITV